MGKPLSLSALLALGPLAMPARRTDAIYAIASVNAYNATSRPQPTFRSKHNACSPVDELVCQAPGHSVGNAGADRCATLPTTVV